MKIVINKNFGGFRLQYDIARTLDVDKYDDSTAVRTDTRLIEWIGNQTRTSLRVVEIPDNATDWDILEYDGMEQIVAVVNGRLQYIR